MGCLAEGYPRFNPSYALLTKVRSGAACGIGLRRTRPSLRFKGGTIIFSRATAMAAVLMLTTVIFLATSCSDQTDELQELPADTIGVVTIGPAGLPVPQNSRTTAVAFDDRGNEVGRVSGGAITAATTVAWRHGLTTASARSVVTLTDTGRSRFPIDENMIEGATANPQSGGALFWFNTARPDGPAVPYRNNYVMTRPDAAPSAGSVPGIMQTAGHCGSSAFGVAVDFDDIVSGRPDTRNRLYELTTSGEPIVRGEWNYPTEFRSFSRTAACSADGSALYNLYGSVAAIRDESGKSDLTLVRIDTATGVRTQTSIDMAGHRGASEANSLTLVEDRLYWISTDGSVLSVPVAGTSNKVREEWRLPQDGKHHQASVSGTVVAFIDYEGTPTYTEFDLVTGNRTRSSIELPWISEALKEGDGSTVLNVSSVPK